MILEELSIRNWRGYREPHTLRFGEGFNLIVGRNESGKSTLFEALARVLFDRYTSKTEEVRQMQPLGSSLGPESSLIFHSNGRRYKVIKRFLQQPICELSIDRGGQWERIHEGDKADNELRTILQGIVPGRMAKPEHRGLAQALWYLQREAPLPERAWTESIKQGLSGLVKLAVKSPEEDRILRLIEKAYNTYFTPTGRIISGSEIATLQEQIPRDEEELQKLRDRTQAVENLRSELEELTGRRAEKEQHLKDAQKDLEEAKRTLEAASVYEEEKRSKEKALEDVKERLQKFTNDQDTVWRRRKKIDEFNKELEIARGDSETLQADARQELLAEGRHHESWRNEHEPALKVVEQNLKNLLALDRLQQLRKEEKRVQDYLQRVNEARQELLKNKQQLAELHAPSKKEWTHFQETMNELRTVEAKAEASAIRVGFDLKDKRVTVKSSPEAQLSADMKEFLITGPTTFTMQGIGNVRVRGGGAPIEELDARLKELHSSIETTLERFGVKDSQGLSNLYQRQSDLEREIRQSQKRLDELKTEEDPETELVRIKRRIEEEGEKTKVTQEEWKKWESQAICEKIEELEKEKKRIIKAIDEEQQKEKKARESHFELMKKSQEASNRVINLQSQIKSLEQENAETLKVYGTLEHLVSLVNQAKEDHNQAKNDLDVLMKDYEVAVELPRKLHKQAEQRAQNLESQLRKIEQDMVDRRARIEEAAAQGFYSQAADLEAALEVKRRRLESLIRRSNATRLLHDMVLAYKREQSAALAGPVAEHMNRWLRLLTEDTYDSVELDEEMLVVGVRSNRYGEPLPLESLSYGTHEQVIVLLRLAIGVLLSSKERNLVVIDDRLVNADSIRMKRLCLILQEVATKYCQVVIATCNDTPYAGIQGHVIRVPYDGKDSP